MYVYSMFFNCYREHRDLNVLTHSLPTRRSSDLRVLPDLSPGALMVRVETAGSWRYLSNRLADAKASARAAPTWVYVMTFAGGTTGGPRGAGHATDVPLVMGNYANLTEMSRTPWFADSRSEEHTSELQSLMRLSYAVFCLKKKNNAN